MRELDASDVRVLQADMRVFSLCLSICRTNGPWMEWRRGPGFGRIDWLAFWHIWVIGSAMCHPRTRTEERSRFMPLSRPFGVHGA